MVKFSTVSDQAQFDLARNLIIKANRMKDVDSLCNLLAQTVYDLNPEGYVTVSLFDPVDEHIKTRSIVGLGEKQQDLMRLLKRDPLTIEGSIDNMGQEALVYKNVFTSGKLEKIPEGIYPLVAGMLSKKEADAIENLLGISFVYTVGFAIDDRPFGGLSLLLTKSDEVKHVPLIEFIASFFSAIIHRMNAEKSQELSEKKYRHRIEAALNGFWEIDRHGVTTYINQEMAQMLGYRPDEILGKHPIDFIQKNFREEAKALLEKRRKGLSGSHDLVLLHKSGREIWARLASVPYIENNQFVGGLACVSNITEQVKAEQALKESEKRYKELANHLQKIREEQNAYIAKEIHDELGQALTALKMNLSMLEQDVQGAIDKNARAGIDASLSEMLLILDQTIDKIRNLSRDLWPSILDTAGIIESLKVLLEEFQEYSSIATRFISQLDELDIDKDCSLAIYRIVQGALNNVARHSNASQVRLEIKLHDNLLHVSVFDNGTGIVLSEKDHYHTFGIMSMKERAAMFNGQLRINRLKKGGTEVLLQIPVKHE